MSSVKIRTSQLKDGRQSIYLDIYHDGKNKHKILKLYLNKPNSTEAKRQNEEIMLVAEKVKIKVQEQILNGTFGKSKIQKDLTLLEWFSQLTEQRRRNGLNYSAWRSMLKHLNAYFASKDSIQLKNLTTSDIENIKDYLLSQVSQNSVASYFDVFKNSIYEAFRRKLIAENIAEYSKSVKYNNPHREFLTEEEIVRLLNADCEMPVLKQAFLFSCFTGLRFSDCENLIWENIQWTKEFGYFMRFVQKKTKGSETLPLSESALKIIGNPPIDLSAKVFRGLRYSAWNNVKLTKWFLKAGITKRSHFHMARHTAATMLIQKGADIFTISKIMGHRDLRSTIIYTKIVDNQKRNAMDLMPNIL